MTFTKYCVTGPVILQAQALSKQLDAGSMSLIAFFPTYMSPASIPQRYTAFTLLFHSLC